MKMESVRDMVNRVYLDHHTTTRPFPSAIDKMLPFFREHWGSAASLHQMGLELISPMHRCLKDIYELIGAANEDHFTFTSSGAEATSQLFLSTYIDSVKETGRNHFLTTCVDEPSTFLSIKRLEQLGCSGKILPVNEQGQLTREILEAAIRPRSALLYISWANGLTGVIHPLFDIAEVCQEKGVRLHVDVTYAIGKLFFRFSDLNVDSISFDGDKLHAPKGTGGLFARAATPIGPLIAGTPTVNMPGLIGLTEALDQVSARFEHLCTETARLRDKLERGIQEGISDAKVLFAAAERLPNCCAIAFPGVMNEALLFALHRKGVYATLGHLSQLLRSCGIEESLANSALSFSLSYETREEEIDYAIETIVSAVKKLRTLGSAL